MVLGLSSFGSWDCRPLGPGIVVLSVLRMDSFRCVECSVLRRKEGRKERREKAEAWAPYIDKPAYQPYLQK